jgi:hypothetical protein
MVCRECCMYQVGAGAAGESRSRAYVLDYRWGYCCTDMIRSLPVSHRVPGTPEFGAGSAMSARLRETAVTPDGPSHCAGAHAATVCVCMSGGKW